MDVDYWKDVNTDYNNISVSSSVEIMNSSDSRMDLNSSNPKS